MDRDEKKSIVPLKWKRTESIEKGGGTKCGVLRKEKLLKIFPPRLADTLGGERPQLPYVAREKFASQAKGKADLSISGGSSQGSGASKKNFLSKTYELGKAVPGRKAQPVHPKKKKANSRSPEG